MLEERDEIGFDDPLASEEVEEVAKPELKVDALAAINDAALKEERYRKLIALGVAEYRAEAGSIDGQAYLAAKIFHRGT